MNDFFLRACRRQPTERTPVWIMRQAGRYLPEYRVIRQKVDFLTLVKTPELAAEVTLQPVDVLGVDAAIIFSDILVLPGAMGMKLEFNETEGPTFPHPIRSQAAIDKLRIPDPNEELKFVMDAIRIAREHLSGRVSLIGFSGSPWTLAAYMVQGNSSHDFRSIKELIFKSPEDANALLEKLAKAVAAYLNAQIEAGAQAVQIFDTWGGILSPDDFRLFSLRFLSQVIQELNRDNVPVIVFAKGANHSLKQIADDGADVVSLDWTVDIGEVRQQIGDKVALQGNLDPCVLYAFPERIRREAKKILSKYGKGPGHIFNLGHGILPDTPVEHVKALVEAVKDESIAFH